MYLFIFPEPSIILTLFVIGVIIYFVASAAKSSVGGMLSSINIDEDEITVKHCKSKNGKAIVGKSAYNKKDMYYVAKIVRASNYDHLGYVFGKSIEELEANLEKKLESCGEIASVRDLVSDDGIFYVRNTGYNEKYNEYAAYIDNVKTKAYIRTVYGKTMTELEENVKIELAKLSHEYSKHR